MINSLIAKVFGTHNEREVKKLLPRVQRINALEPEMQKLTDAELRAKTDEFRKRVQDRLAQLQEPSEEEMDADRRKVWEKEQYSAIEEALDTILEEAFAVVREGGRRVLNMRHFDVQLIGGMVLHSGRISEMKTGEGKTLVATLPVYLNALSGRGAVIVDVAIDQGGCVETARPTTHSDPSYTEHGVVHYCVTNIPAAVPHTSTLALTNATFPYVMKLAKNGIESTLRASTDIQVGVNTFQGALTYKAVADSQQKHWTPISSLV